MWWQFRCKFTSQFWYNFEGQDKTPRHLSIQISFQLSGYLSEECLSIINCLFWSKINRVLLWHTERQAAASAARSYWNALWRSKIGPRPIAKRHPKRQNFKAAAVADARCGHPLKEIKSTIPFLINGIYIIQYKWRLWYVIRIFQSLVYIRKKQPLMFTVLFFWQR